MSGLQAAYADALGAFAAHGMVPTGSPVPRRSKDVKRVALRALVRDVVTPMWLQYADSEAIRTPISRRRELVAAIADSFDKLDASAAETLLTDSCVYIACKWACVLPRFDVDVVELSFIVAVVAHTCDHTEAPVEWLVDWTRKRMLEEVLRG